MKLAFSKTWSVNLGSFNKHIPLDLVKKLIGGGFHGSVDINTTLSASAHMAWGNFVCSKSTLFGVCYRWKLDYFESWFELNSHSKIAFTGAAQGLLLEDFGLLDFPLWDIIYPLPPAPGIPLVPGVADLRFEFEQELETELHLIDFKMTFGAEVNASFKAGARWQSGWSNILQIQSTSTHVNKATFNVSAAGLQVDLAFPLKVRLLIDLLGGPYVEFNPSVTFGGTYVAPPPSGTWYVRIDFEVNVGIGLAGWLGRILGVGNFLYKYFIPHDYELATLYSTTVKTWTGTWGDNGVTLDSTPHPSKAIPATGIGLSGTVVLKQSLAPVSNNTVKVWVNDCVYQYCIASPVNSTTTTDNSGQYFMGFDAPSPSAGACTCVVYMELDFGVIHQVSSSILIIRPTVPVDVPVRDSNGTIIGHVSSDLLGFDDTPPKVSATTTPSPNVNGWSNQDVAVIWNVSDQETRVRSSSGCEPVVLTAETVDQEIVCTATNDAGLTTSESTTVMIDKTPPLVTPGISPELNDLGWSDADVSVTFECYDALSGVYVLPDSPQNITTEGIEQSRSGTCVDEAGNAGEATFGGISIDKTPPGKLIHSLSPTPDANGWNHGSVAVEFSCSDSLSGADTVFGVYGVLSLPATNRTELFTVPLIVGEGTNQSVTGICSDRAGNLALDTVRGINVDKASVTPEGLPLTTYALAGAVVVIGSMAAALVSVVRRLRSEVRSLTKQFVRPPTPPINPPGGGSD